MLSDKKIAVIIPVFNEEKTLPLVFKDMPEYLVDEVVVIDNGSSDRTPEIAKELGATLLFESRKGYGYPCLKGIAYLKTNTPDIVVFVDGNHSDYTDEMIRLVTPIIKDDYDLVIGSRTTGSVEKGALRVPVRFGNFLATMLIMLLYGFKYTDIGPFRAIKFDKLLKMDMNDNLGWTVEMQAKAIKMKFRILEVPVSYRTGTGKSKITGNLKGIFLVGYRILRAVFKNLFYSPNR
ncbi:MAG TPA: glycosyltransferase family 2 protein [Nitrospirae bacterium]|nr:glycosyltransferase family 2 protein [Nitrospirota bacterium]